MSDTMTPREEALLCEIVRLRMVLEQMRKDNSNLQEIIGLYKQLAGDSHERKGKPDLKILPLRARTINKSHPTKKCDYPPCHVVMNTGQRYCGRSHMLKHRWDLGLMNNRKKRTIPKGA